MSRQLRREDYTVVWVCTLLAELAAAQEMLDERHGNLQRNDDDDDNLYILGSICGHNVVIVCLPASYIGNNPVANVAAQLRTIFKEIRFALLVGIGGGVPNEEADIRLGDVVVGTSTVTFGGAVQHDILNSPPQTLLSAIAQFRTDENTGTERLAKYISKLERLPRFQRDRAGPDVLFESTYEHEDGDEHDGGYECRNCNADRQKDRKPRDRELVVAHYGKIASGSYMMRNAVQRDKASASLGGVLCFETGAAGLKDVFPCLVVRGICNYADSHKNRRWQAYAAGTAAAWAKALLSVIHPVGMMKAHTPDEAMEPYDGFVRGTKEEYSQPSSPKHSFVEASTIPSTVSHTHGFPETVWSSTGHDSEIATDATDHATQNSASNVPNEEQKTVLPELSPARTVYAPSATLTTPALGVKGYADELAEQLFGAVNCIDLAQDAMDRLSQSLPDLLRAFAVKVGYRASSRMHYDVMFYVRRDRVSVQQAFQRLIDDASQPEDPVKVDEGLGQDAIDRFMKDMEEFDDVPEQQIDTEADDLEQQIDTEAVDAEQDEEQQYFLYEKGKIFDFILDNPAYKWLVDTLKRETTLKRASPDLMGQIGAQIRDVLLHHGNTVSRKAPSQEYEANFEMIWHPRDCLKDQSPHIDPEEVLGGAITLTGTVNDAQALTTLEYLCQVWPESGMHVMQLITDVACQESEHIATASLPDGTQFQARIKNDYLIVNVVGSSESLAEAGQQLAWLGAALQMSSIETNMAAPHSFPIETHVMAICAPFIQWCYFKHDPPSSEASEQRQQGKMICRMGFDVRIPHIPEIEHSGLCWHKMFTCPIIVSGFPILRKPEPKLGLEMSLDLLAGMVGASQVLGIQGKVFLKGFSTMLVGVRRLDDLLIWHFSFNEDGNRISYLSAVPEQACDMSVDKIEELRHVVGWSVESSYYAGAADADYDIKGTDLPPPRAGALLEKFTFNIGKIFTAGATIAPRVKRISPHFTRDVYEQKLMWMENNYVVLWDEETKRGWLVNGTSALLHLVRMSLKLYKRDYSQELLFDESMIQNEAEHDATSARKVLKKARNRDLEIWRGKSENVLETEQQLPIQNQPSASHKTKKSRYTFENLVEQKLSVLEALIDNQKQLVGLSGINLKLRFRRHLEGWNFQDLAGESDPEPRVATLKAIGYGWVDFVHSLKAITLFGYGFGNIIRPSKRQRICSQWSQLPRGEYHLAASLHDLDIIMSKTRMTERGDIEIVRGLLWHSPLDPFTPCKCLSRSQTKDPREPCTEKHNPVQALLPKALTKGSILFPSPRKPENLNNKGAVVFGHTMSWTSNHGLTEIGGVASKEGSLPDLSKAQAVVSEASLQMKDLAFERSYPVQSVRTDEEPTRTLRPVDNKAMAPERCMIRNAGNPPPNRPSDVADTIEEDMEVCEDDWGKMWWQNIQLSRDEPNRRTAYEYSN